MSRDTGPVFYPPTNKPYFPPKFGGDVLKLAVRLDLGMSLYVSSLQLDDVKDATQFIEFRQKELLPEIVKSLCTMWNLKDHETFALQWTTRDALQLPYHYVTEDNRQELKNGEVLYLTLSPATLCKFLMQRLKQFENENTLDKSLEKLSQIISDPAVAAVLLEQGGLQDIEAMIQSGQLANMSLSSAYLLSTFWQLMEGCKKSWDEVNEKLIHEVAFFVIGGAKIASPKATSVALAIIEAIATSSSQFSTVEKEVPIENLVILLFSSDAQVQHNALAVMNALFTHSESNGKEKIAQLLRSKAVREPIMQNVLRQKTQVGAELAHQLHVLQRNLMNMYEIRSKTKLLQNSPDAEKLTDLRRSLLELSGEAFSPTNSRKNPSTNYAREFKKLGFRNLMNPSEDLELTPPGVLALDCMVYFAEKHKQNFTKFISENSYRTDNRECPFAQTSVQLVNVLLELCEVGQPPAEEGKNYYELFFTHEYPFEELFSLGIVLLNRTWKEMKASISDMSKVVTVVKEQIKRSMEKQSENFKNLENETKTYTYGEVSKLWDQEQVEKEKIEFSTPPIIQLREILKPQYVELVKTNRFYALKEGQEFAKYSRGQRGAREKGKFWYWRLSPNEKFLLYADCKEQEVPKVEEMKCLVEFEDVYEIRVGNECPYIKELKTKNKTTSNELAFSILLKNTNTDDCFNFLAADANTFYTWIDGLNAAMGKAMPSQLAAQEMEIFLRLDIKLRLMELEDIPIPNTPPLVPPPPSWDGLFS